MLTEEPGSRAAMLSGQFSPDEGNDPNSKVLLVDGKKKSIDIGSGVDVATNNLNQVLTNEVLNSRSQSEATDDVGTIDMDSLDPETQLLAEILHRIKNKHIFLNQNEVTPYTKFRPR